MREEEMQEAGSSVLSAKHRAVALTHIRRQEFVEKVGPEVRTGWLARRSAYQREH